MNQLDTSKQHDSVPAEPPKPVELESVLDDLADSIINAETGQTCAPGFVRQFHPEVIDTLLAWGRSCAESLAKQQAVEELKRLDAYLRGLNLATAAEYRFTIAGYIAGATAKLKKDVPR